MDYLSCDRHRERAVRPLRHVGEDIAHKPVEPIFVVAAVCVSWKRLHNERLDMERFDRHVAMALPLFEHARQLADIAVVTAVA